MISTANRCLLFLVESMSETLPMLGVLRGFPICLWYIDQRSQEGFNMRPKARALLES